MTLKVHDRNRERLSTVGPEVQITSFSWLHELRHRGEICFKPISIAVNHCVTNVVMLSCNVTLRENREIELCSRFMLT